MLMYYFGHIFKARHINYNHLKEGRSGQAKNRHDQVLFSLQLNKKEPTMSIPTFSKHTAISVFAVAAITAPTFALAGPTNVPLKMSAVTQEQTGYTPNCPS